MTLPPLLAAKGAATIVPGVDDHLVYLAGAAVVLILFLVGSRIVSNLVVRTLERRHMRTDMVVTGGRVVTFLLIAVGVMFAIGLAFQSQNLTLAGILLATIVASFGVQDLLKDYVSGYYVLLERHIRQGDHITLEGAGSGVVLDVKLRVTLVKTESGDLLVVPNSELFTKPVTVHVGAVERAAETTKPQPPG